MALPSRNRISRLTLGTASLGMAYGIAGDGAPLTEDTAAAIMSEAWQAGLRCFDTALAYGEAERRIGDWAADTKRQPVVVTKLPGMSATPDADAATAIQTSVITSQTALRQRRLDGCLTHRAADYLRPDVMAALHQLRDAGEIDAYGLSAYTADEVRQALVHAPPDMIQVPVSMVDRRMVQDGTLDACRAAGTTVFARSVFLQGALLMLPEELPDHLSPLASVLTRLSAVAEEAGASKLQLLLGAVMILPQVDSVIVGVQGARQLQEIVDAATKPMLDAAVIDAAIDIAGDIPPDCLDPRNWPA